MHVFGQWEEAGIHGENPRIHRENMQTPHRKAPVYIYTKLHNFIMFKLVIKGVVISYSRMYLGVVVNDSASLQ